VTASSPGPRAEARPAGPMPGIPDDDDEDVSVLTLAGKIPSKDGEWLLITSLDGQPGAEFLARHLGRDELSAHGSDVLVRLVPEGGTPRRPQIRAQVWVVLGGRLILAGSWERQDFDWWPEQIRAGVAFAMGMITELEEHGADLGARHRVRLDDPDAATVGVPLGITSGPAAQGQPGT
jgi:hypothetical protein